MRLVQVIRIALALHEGMEPFTIQHNGFTYRITPVCLRRDGTKMWQTERV